MKEELVYVHMLPGEFLMPAKLQTERYDGVTPRIGPVFGAWGYRIQIHVIYEDVNNPMNPYGTLEEEA